MPISDYKVTDIERDAVRMQGKADPLQGTLAQNQAEFDEYPELVRDNLDGLCDYIATMPISYLSSVAEGTANKGSITGFVPLGAILEISMTNGNTSASPTISIDGVTHTFINMPTTAQVQANSTQTYRFVKTGATALTFTKNPDYICEYGTINSWNFQKWAGGKSSCEIISATVALSATTAYGTGGIYIRNTSLTGGTGVSIPNIFVSAPAIIATLNSSGQVWLVVGAYATGTVPFTANANFIQNTAGSAGETLSATFLAVGKWY